MESPYTGVQSATPAMQPAQLNGNPFTFTLEPGDGFIDIVVTLANAGAWGLEMYSTAIRIQKATSEVNMVNQTNVVETVVETGNLTPRAGKLGVYRAAGLPNGLTQYFRLRAETSQGG